MREFDDSALEARLREVLKERLGALPLDLTVEALDRRREAKGVGRRVGRGRGITLLAAAALLLVGGAVAAGSGFLRLPTVVPPVPEPSVVAIATASPAAETPAPEVSHSPTTPTEGRPWMTGRELMDALSAADGYQWSPLLVNNETWFTSGPVDSVAPIDVLAPIDGPAKVKVGGAVDQTAEVAQKAGRVAQVLAPDVAPWIQDAIAQGLNSYTQGIAGGDRTSTATGGRVDVEYVDEPLIGDWMHVSFSFPPDPPSTRALEPGGSIVLYPVYGGDDPSNTSAEIWAVNPDGTDAGLFIPSPTNPDGVADVLGWSADGSRLFYRALGGMFAIDADGSHLDPVGGPRDKPLCPVADDICQANEDISISPDGTRLAYSFQEGSESDIHTIAVLDVASGQVTRLDATRAPGVDMPSWSPDGTRLVYGCPGIRPRTDGICRVNVDGSDLRQILPAIAGDCSDHQWSPDGSSILFAVDGGGRAELFTIGSDGAGLRSLTNDGLAEDARWTRDGRIVFMRFERGSAGEGTGRGDLWIMDADGGNATTIDATIPAQTAAGCLVCPFPDDQGLYYSEDHDTGYRFWQPSPEGQP